MYYTGNFDETVDVIVVGFGDAGAIAAMTAHDEGAEVLVVEKQREDARRPNSRFSGGIFLSPNDPDAAEHYIRELYRINDELYETDPAVLRTWAVETSQNVAWLGSIGGTSEMYLDHGEHRHIEGAESIHMFRPTMHEHPNGTGRSGWGWGLFKFLTEHVERRGIRVQHDVSAKWLLEGGTGAVIGLRVNDHGRTRNIGASRGVVLATGGFEFNPWMKWNHLRVNPTHFYGSPENTGDGILMATEVGAESWHMNDCSARVVAHFPDSGYPGGVMLDIWGVEGGHSASTMTVRAETAVTLAVADAEVSVDVKDDLPGVLFVNRYGRRFTSEIYRAHSLYYELTDMNTQTLELPKVPSWYVFDSRRLGLSRLVPDMAGPAGPLEQVRWSADNRAEVDRGWVLSATSIEQLAVRCDIDPDTLKSTVEQYNRYCKDGHDPDFGRPAVSMRPLEGPEYYAIKLWPGGPNTQGGPRRNADGQVMRVTGEPIPRLYSAGELGSMYGMMYPSGGGNIAECMAFGRLAGRNVAALRPV